MSSFHRFDYTKKRKVLSARQKQHLAQAASFHLPQLAKQQTNINGKVKVGIYYDGFGELPTQPILDWCNMMGYQAYLPVVGSLTSCDKRLRFSPINQKKLINLPTYKHALGMLQHKHRYLIWANQLDIIFCPLVAINKVGNRVGMGGGYYDRTLKKIHMFNIPKPIKVGWCYDFQVLNNDVFKSMPWDVPMDFIITPKQFIRV